MPDEPFELPPDLLGRIPLFAELAKVLSWTGGPVNWDLARQIAVALAAGEEQAHDVARSDADELTEAFRLADLWLAEGPGIATPSKVATVGALTPARWAERATVLRELVDPLAAKIVASVRDQSSEIAPEGEAAMLGPVMAQMMPVFMGIQAGVVLGTLASSVFGTYDIPMPVAEEGAVDLVVPTIDAFADSYGLDRRETRMWVTLHQAAHRSLFEATPGISAQFFAMFHNYVAALQVDLSGAFDRLQSLDVTSPERLREAMEQEGFFGHIDSPGAAEALAKLQRFLAMLEAFADRAVDAAASRLPSALRIAEAMSRRASDAGPGQKMFQRFIGVEVPQDLVRTADAFCRGVIVAGGWPALSRLWEDPESLPSVEELLEPSLWLGRIAT
ncbi:MAG: zinc-dependent metalloprotease [Actinomycetota bacterium]